MHLQDVWFILIAVLWTGYFFLEGFDFGVGILTKLLARGETERRVLINTIGPVWDGNEVWLITAGGATFAAFPDWYATLFSGFYLPLFAIVVSLIIRGVAFEYRAKRDGERWKRNWEHAIFWASLLPAFLWGVAFADIVHGVPIDAAKNVTGSVLDLLTPYALLGGTVSVAVFTFHGAVFAALKTVGDIRHRARRLALRLGPATALLLAAFLTLTQVHSGNVRSLVALAVSVAALLAALVMVRGGREGWAFALSGAAVAAAAAVVFLALFPDVMPSSTNPAYSLTVSNAASGPYTLKLMTWVAAVFTPLVVAYQGWTYWVFRKRIGVQHIPAPHTPHAPRAPRTEAPADPADRPESAAPEPGTATVRRIRPLGPVDSRR